MVVEPMPVLLQGPLLVQAPVLEPVQVVDHGVPTTVARKGQQGPERIPSGELLARTWSQKWGRRASVLSVLVLIWE